MYCFFFFPFKKLTCILSLLCFKFVPFVLFSGFFKKKKMYLHFVARLFHKKSLCYFLHADVPIPPFSLLLFMSLSSLEQVAAELMKI